MKKIIFLFLVLISNNIFGQWNQLKTPTGNGDVNFVAAKNNKIIIKKYYSNDLFISIDDGANWNQIKNYTFSKSIWSIAFKDNDIYIGTYGDGLIKTTDNGLTFTKINSFNSNNCGSVLVNNDSIYVGFDNGFYISTNNGVTWTKKINGLQNTSISKIYKFENKLYTKTFDYKFYISLNNGDNWDTVFTELNKYSNYFYNIAQSGVNVYACNGHDMYKSTNNGKNWKEVNYFDNLSSKDFIDVYTNNNIFYVITNYGLYYSVNNGIDWIYKSEIFDILKNNYYYNNLFKISNIDGNKIYLGSENSLYKLDGVSSEWVNIGFEKSNINAVLKENDKIWLGTSGGLFYSSDNFKTWKSLGLFNKTINAIAKNDSGVFILTNNELYVVKKNNSLLEKINIYGDVSYFKDLKIDSNKIILGYDKGVIASYDYGKTWTPLNTGIPKDEVVNIQIIDNVIYAYSEDYDAGGLYYFNNNEKRWHKWENDFINKYYEILAMYKRNNELLLKTYENINHNTYLYSSKDKGLTWTKIEGSFYFNYLYNSNNHLFLLYYTTLKVIPNNERKLYNIFEYNTNLFTDIFWADANDSTIIIGDTKNGLFSKNLLLAMNDAKICSGLNATLKPKQIIGKKCYEYKWDDGVVSDSISVKVNDYDYKKHTVIGYNGSQYDTISAYISAAYRPQILINHTSLNNWDYGYYHFYLCMGDSLALNSSGASKYLWSTGETSDNIILKPKTNQEINVYGENIYQCKDTAKIKIEVRNYPAKPKIEIHNFQLTATSGNHHTWYLNGEAISGAFNNSYKPIELGYYQVKASDYYKCEIMSDTFYLESLIDEEYENSIKIFPNPVAEKLYLNKTTDTLCVIKIYNTTGKLVKEYLFKEKELSIDFADMPNGVYLISLWINNIEKRTYKLIK